MFIKYIFFVLNIDFQGTLYIFYSVFYIFLDFVRVYQVICIIGDIKCYNAKVERYEINNNLISLF